LGKVVSFVAPKSIIFSGILFSFLSTAKATEITAMNPAEYLGDYRLIVACNTQWKPTDINRDGFNNRDLKAFELIEGKSKLVELTNSGDLDRIWLDRSSRFNRLVKCEGKNEFVLVGKDRGVKKRWQRLPSEQELFETIDAMPIRQYEMRNRGGN